MATFTATNNIFDSFVGKPGGALDLSAIAPAVLILNSTLEPDQANDEFVSDVSANEITGNGYGRIVLANPAWALSGGANGQFMLDSDNPVWTASGGSIIGRWWVLFNNTPATDAARDLIAYGLFDNTPADVTTTDGNTLSILIPALGFFTQDRA